MRQNLVKFALLLPLLHLVPGPALADGCYIPRPPAEEGVDAFKDLNSPRQQAILVNRLAYQEMYVRVVLRGAPEEFAWVMPLPAKPESAHLENDGEGVFESAYALTAPEWYEAHDLRSGCGMESGSSLGKGDGDGEPGVDVVWESDLGGGLEMQVLEATGGEVLEEWLQDNGYAIPDGLGELAQDYVDRDWVFMAMKVTGDAALAKDEMAALQVLHVVWPGEETVFPMNLTRLNAPLGGLELTLFVFGYHCMRADGMGVYYSDIRGGQYQQWDLAKSTAAYHGSLSATTTGMWVVRLNGVFFKHQMEDIYLYRVEDKVVHPEPRYWAGLGGRRSAVLLALAVLALVAFGGLAAVRWRTGGER
jgi:hypothetical protein